MMRYSYQLPPGKTQPTPGSSGVALLSILIMTLVVLTGCREQERSSVTSEPATRLGSEMLSSPTNQNTTLTTNVPEIDLDVVAVTEQAEAEMAATIAAEMLATAIHAEATETAAARGTPTPDYAEQATATGQAQKIAKLTTVQAAPIFSGPMDGYLQAKAGEKPEPGSAAVNLRNFVAKTLFAFQPSDGSDPEAPGDEQADIGIALQFRRGNIGYYALDIYKNGRWEHVFYDGESITLQASGQIDWLDPIGWNDLALYVDEIRGFFLVNGRLASQLEIGDGPHSGDIALGMVYPTGSDGNRGGIDYLDFTIWAMEPILPTATPTPTLTPYPTVTPVVPMPPEGFGQVTLINQTTDRPLTVEIDECLDFTGTVNTGQRVVCEVPEGTYSWRVWGWGCERSLPTINVVRDVTIEIKILPSENQCRYSVSLCLGGECEILETNQLR